MSCPTANASNTTFASRGAREFLILHTRSRNAPITIPGECTSFSTYARHIPRLVRLSLYSLSSVCSKPPCRLPSFFFFFLFLFLSLHFFSFNLALFHPPLSTLSTQPGYSFFSPCPSFLLSLFRVSNSPLLQFSPVVWEFFSGSEVPR
ncbi:hypothetical protein PUN28_001388 [Cardiocondyla obscurior]|uniref:Transmembrane protein n=1 Tax=Cardiocondyla obscurior TaxID=286306 RepID=A0AAW2H516_9HYME